MIKGDGMNRFVPHRNFIYKTKYVFCFASA